MNRLKYWAALAAAIILVISAVWIWELVHGHDIGLISVPPAQEIASTDAAIKSADSKIVIIQQRLNNLPEVIKDAKSAARSRIDSYNGDDLADAWNSRLEQYRQDNTASAGL